MIDLRKLDQLGTAFRQLKAGCYSYDVPLLNALITSLTLYLRDDFSLKEITGYALYAPAIRNALPVLISKERSLAKLARTNPQRHQEQTENKAVFYERCRVANLPIPQSYGVFEGGRGSDGDGNPLDGRADWISHLETRLPTHFIIKDLRGAYASGFTAFERRDGMFHRMDGCAFDAAGLYDDLARSAPAAFILQERLFDHPALETLSGCKGLQTMRINTIRDDDDSVSLLFYMIKILVGENIADNFSMGTTGNLIAIGRADDGILECARTRHPCGSGLTTIERHPGTGIPFDGYRIPLWKEAIALAKAAHRCFPAFGSLGWDVAITPQGPKLIEANAWWDPPNYAPQIMSAEYWRRIFA